MESSKLAKDSKAPYMFVFRVCMCWFVLVLKGLFGSVNLESSQLCCSCFVYEECVLVFERGFSSCSLVLNGLSTVSLVYV